MVLIIHPLLEMANIKQILSISKKLKFDKVINIVEDIKILEKDIKICRNSVSILLPNKRLKKIYKLENVFRERLLKKYPIFANKDNNIYLRSNYKYIDTVVLSVFHKPHIFKIDDGLADYLDQYWFFYRLNFHQIKFFFRNVIIKFYYFLIFLFTNGLNTSLYKIIFYRYVNFKDKFSVKPAQNSKLISKYFFNVLGNLRSKKISEKILIIGTTIDKNYLYNVRDETKIYNKLIEIIVKEHGVRNNQILYKHHPRVSYKDWKYKKKYLNCNLLKFSNDILAETLMSNQNLISIYSFGSTSLIYAKKLFKIDSNLVYFKNSKRHPSSNEMYLYIAKKEKIKVIYI